MQTQSITTNPSPSFEELLPKMLRQFRYFAGKVLRLRRDRFADALQDLVGIALEIYRSLIRRGKTAFYSPIVRYSIKRYKAGRRCTGSNTTDILSHQAQIMGRSETCSLDQLNDEGDVDTRYFMQDKTTDVFHAIQMQMDYQDWYHRQSTRDQQIIEDLAMGETTTAVAKKFGVSPALISIKRKNFAKSWNWFIDPPEENCAVVAA